MVEPKYADPKLFVADMTAMRYEMEDPQLKPEWKQNLGHQQLDVIQEGLNAGVDMTVYATPDLTPLRCRNPKRTNLGNRHVDYAKPGIRGDYMPAVRQMLEYDRKMQAKTGAELEQSPAECDAKEQLTQ